MSTNYYGLAVPLALRRFRIAPFARNLYGQKVSLPRDLSPGINILHLNYRRKHRKVEEKNPKENFRVNREMRDEILVYDPFLTKFWTKIASKCRENAGKIWIKFIDFRV